MCDGGNKEGMGKVEKSKRTRNHWAAEMSGGKQCMWNKQQKLGVLKSGRTRTWSDEGPWTQVWNQQKCHGWPCLFPSPLFHNARSSTGDTGEKACLRLAKWKKLPLHVSRWRPFLLGVSEVTWFFKAVAVSKRRAAQRAERRACLGWIAVLWGKLSHSSAGVSEWACPSGIGASNHG